ncbi:MAG: BamA/TamA family outer membrane protein [Saprospiraceae bacterium]
MGIVLFVFSSCNTTKYLKDDEFLLKSNDIALETDAKKGEIGSLEYQLSTLTKQKPNKKTLGFTRARLWWYYRAKRSIERSARTDTLGQIQKDTSRFYKVVLKRYAEPPTIHNVEKMDATAQSMEYYLNNRGFYGARVSSAIDTNKKLVTVIYSVTTDSFMRVGNVQHITDDLNIKQLLPQIKRGSLLKRNIPLDSRTFNQEKARILSLIKNEGYRYVYPTNIIYEGDSSGLATNVKAIILPPTDSTFHQKYHIGKIYVNTQYYPSANIRTQYDTVLYDGYHFIKKTENDFQITLKALKRSLYINSDSLYRYNEHDQTSKALGRMGVFKFVSVKTRPSEIVSPDGRNLIDFYIYLTPEEKIDIGWNGEVSFISGDRILTEALGLFFNTNFINKNVFKGGEKLKLSAGYGIESPLSSTTLIDLTNTFTQDVRLQADLTLPPFYKNANLRFSTAYNLVQRFQQYRYNLFNAEIGIDWKSLRSQKKLTFNPLSINYLNPIIEEDFQSTLDDNPLLARSFDAQLIAGSNATFSWSKQNLASNESYSFIANMDFSGNFLNLINQIFQPDAPFIFGINKDITYSQYSIFEIDGRYFKTYNRNLTLAMRFNTGVGFSYLNSKETGLPYVKQFSAGGNTGIRAWQVRQLGPGGEPELELEDVFPFQTGDFKAELNTELRFSLDFLASGMEGAAFADFGNVWSLKDTTNNNVKLLRVDNFLNRIAVGVGGGIRWDLSFFILRLDYAWKLRRPYSATGDDTDGSSYWESAHIQQIPIENQVSFWRQGRVNIAIGYPF